MTIQRFFLNDNQQLKVIWRIVLFTTSLSITLLPLIMIDDKLLQFLGAVLLLLIGLYINSKYFDKRKFSEYGLLFNRQFLAHLLIGVFIASCSVILMLIIGKTAKIILLSDFNYSINILSLLHFFLKMFLVAIIEETFFRGYLFISLKDAFKSKMLSKKQTVLVALITSSLLFGLAHFSNNNVSILSLTFLTINGIVWCIPFIITKNLGLSIGLHTAWNFTQIQLGFTMSGNKASNSFYKVENIGSNLFTGGDYGPESGILGLIGFGLMLMMSILYLSRSKSDTFYIQFNKT